MPGSPQVWPKCLALYGFTDGETEAGGVQRGEPFEPRRSIGAAEQGRGQTTAPPPQVGQWRPRPPAAKLPSCLRSRPRPSCPRPSWPEPLLPPPSPPSVGLALCVEGRGRGLAADTVDQALGPGQDWARLLCPWGAGGGGPLRVPPPGPWLAAGSGLRLKGLWDALASLPRTCSPSSLFAVGVGLGLSGGHSALVRRLWPVEGGAAQCHGPMTKGQMRGGVWANRKGVQGAGPCPKVCSASLSDTPRGGLSGHQPLRQRPRRLAGVLCSKASSSGSVPPGPRLRAAWVGVPSRSPIFQALPEPVGPTRRGRCRHGAQSLNSRWPGPLPAPGQAGLAPSDHSLGGGAGGMARPHLPHLPQGPAALGRMWNE